MKELRRFPVNYFSKVSDSYSGSFSTVSRCLLVAWRVLSSECRVQKEKSHLKKSGPRIDPCGTSKSISLQELKVLFILTFWLLFVKWGCRSFKDGISNPYAWSLTISKS